MRRMDIVPGAGFPGGAGYPPAEEPEAPPLPQNPVTCVRCFVEMGPEHGNLCGLCEGELDAAWYPHEAGSQ